MQCWFSAVLISVTARLLHALPASLRDSSHSHPPTCSESCQGPEAGSVCTFCRRSGVTLVHLEGRMELMGAAYGALLRKELTESYELLLDHFKDEDLMYDEALLFDDRYSPAFRPFLQGIARGSGLSLRQAIILNAQETITKGAQANARKGRLHNACLFASVPPQWTRNNRTLLLRNYDFPPPFDRIASNLLVTVIKEQDKLPVAIIGLPGQIYCPTCLNGAGLFLELNNGMPSGGFDVDYKKKSMLINMLEFMQESTTTAELSRALRSSQSDYSLILNAGSAAGAVSHEFSSFNGSVEVAIDITTPFVSTNFFLSPAWGLPPPDSISSWWAPVRRNNMLKLLRENRGQMDMVSAEEVMDVGMKEGGSKWLMTIYQIIYEPASKRLALRANIDGAWAHFPLQYWLSPTVTSL